MDRKIMGFLREWKQSSHRKPLILQGARQVGKTYSILEFGRMYFINTIRVKINIKINKFNAKMHEHFLFFYTNGREYCFY